MSEVKRIDIDHKGLPFTDNNGVYVFYEDYVALEAKCAALAAENARLKSAVTRQIELRAEIKKAGRPPHADFWVQSICEAEEKVKRAIEETPATDAFLAEVRAQGVEMLAKNHQSIVNALKGDSLFSDGEYRHAAIVSAAVYFAAELRKGGEQK